MNKRTRATQRALNRARHAEKNAMEARSRVAFGLAAWPINKLREYFLETFAIERDLAAKHFGDHRPDHYLHSAARARRQDAARAYKVFDAGQRRMSEMAAAG